MRKLPQFGCSGQYDESNKELTFFYDGFKIGWQDKAGYPHRPKTAPTDREKEAGARPETRIKKSAEIYSPQIFLT